MRRYIDAYKIPYHDLSDGKGLCQVAFLEDVIKVPTADVVEVVRCDQCRHFDAINNDDHGWCKLISDLPCEMSVRYDDDFCSYGERKES